MSSKGFEAVPRIELLMHCQKFPNDELAWFELYNRLYPFLRGQAPRFVQRHDFSDFVQTAFIKFSKALKLGLQFGKEVEVDAYLRKIVRNLGYDCFRAKGRMSRVSLVDAADLARLGNALDLSTSDASSEVVDILREYIDRTYIDLEADTVAIVRRKIEGDKNSAIHKEILVGGVSVKAAKQKIYRALRKFKRRLGTEIRKDIAEGKLTPMRKGILERFLRKLERRKS